MAGSNDFAAINLRLGMLGLPLPDGASEDDTLVMQPLLARQREFRRHLEDHLAPVDQRIQDFLDTYLEGTSISPKLPVQTLVLDQPGENRKDGSCVAVVSGMPAVSPREGVVPAAGLVHAESDDVRCSEGRAHGGGRPRPAAPRPGVGVVHER